MRRNKLLSLLFVAILAIGLAGCEKTAGEEYDSSASVTQDDDFTFCQVSFQEETRYYKEVGMVHNKQNKITISWEDGKDTYYNSEIFCDDTQNSEWDSWNLELVENRNYFLPAETEEDTIE